MCDFNLKGLAIGLQSETGEMMAIFMAVMMHKAVMAFSLGLNIAQSSLSVCIALRSSNVAHYTHFPSPTPKVRSFVFSSITFSLASPLGVAIGQWESSRLVRELCILNLLFSFPQVSDSLVCLLQFLNRSATGCCRSQEVLQLFVQSTLCRALCPHIHLHAC